MLKGKVYNGFNYLDFGLNMAKFVRENHIVDEHHNWRNNWDERKINKLKE